MRQSILRAFAVCSLVAMISSLLLSACTDAPTFNQSKTVARRSDARAQLGHPRGAASQSDGNYTAQVSTWTDTYQAPVKVASGRVVSIYWPKWGNVAVNGGALSGDFAEGITAHGEMVRIELERRIH